MEEHCPQPGLPVREDFIIVAEALSQVSQVKAAIIDSRLAEKPLNNYKKHTMFTPYANPLVQSSDLFDDF